MSSKFILFPVLVMATVLGRSQNHFSVPAASHSTSVGMGRNSGGSAGGYHSTTSYSPSRQSYGSSYSGGGFSSSPSSYHTSVSAVSYGRSNNSYMPQRTVTAFSAHDAAPAGFYAGSKISLFIPLYVPSWATPYQVQALQAQPGRVPAVENKYSLTPLPKTVPLVEHNDQKGHSDAALPMATGNHGMVVNPFYTPGFSQCDNGTNEIKQSYQNQYTGFCALTGLRIGALYNHRCAYCSGRYYYWNHYTDVACYAQYGDELARVKTFAELKELLRNYYGCIQQFNDRMKGDIRGMYRIGSSRSGYWVR